MATPSFIDADAAQAAAASAPAGQPLKPVNAPVHTPPPDGLKIEQHQPSSAEPARVDNTPSPLVRSPEAGERQEEAPAGEEPPEQPKREEAATEHSPLDLANDLAEAMAKAEPVEEKKPAKKETPAEPAKEEKKEAAPTPTASQLDTQLKAAESLLHPNIGSGTKKGIEAMRAAYKAEIEALKTAAAKATELETKARDLEAKLAAKQVELPEPTKKELDELRAFRREVDVTKDPEFTAKYDGKIEANIGKVEGILTTIAKSVGQTPEVIAKTLAYYKKEGYTVDALSAEIRALNDAGQFGQAQRLTNLLMQNEELQEKRRDEITEWQKNREGMSAQREAQQKQFQTETSEVMRNSYSQTINAETEAYAKEFPFIKAPPAPDQNDAPAVAQAKTEAQKFYTEAMAKAKADLDAFFAPIEDQRQLAARNGRLYAMAGVGLTFKNLVAPKMAREIASLKAEIEQLRGRVASNKKSGDLSQRHAVEASGAQKRAPAAAHLSTEEVLAQNLEAAIQSQ